MTHSHGKERDWLEWGVRGKVSGQSRAGKVRAAKDQGGQRPGGLRAKSALNPQERERVLCLRTYIVGGIGEKKSHIDERINVVPAFSWGNVTTQT